MNAFVARQPIFNRRMEIFGYELLFRNGGGPFLPPVDGDAATQSVLSNSLFAIGMDTLAGGAKAFINFTQNLLTRKLPALLPIENTVVEVLENVEATAEVVAACRELSQQGYLIALDDFAYSPDRRPLVETADILKIDFLRDSPETIQKTLDSILPFKGLRLLAEKIETYDLFKLAQKMGFEYFQGFFFCKPELLQARQIELSQMNMLQVIRTIHQPDFDFDKIESLVKPDLGLSYRLLRYINAAFFAHTQPISSIRQALVYMGEMEIRRFVSLVALHDLAKNKPGELIRAACVRAKFCELMASPPAKTAPPAEDLFTLGLFSLIDAMLDQSMHDVMGKLPLSTEIKEALVNRKGRLIGYLFLAESYEKGHWTHVARLAGALGIAEEQLPGQYLQACRWANAFSEISPAD